MSEQPSVNERFYSGRDIMGQGEYYVRHVIQMTAEGLHAKSDIAAELAHRDIQIDRLQSRVAELERERNEARAVLTEFQRRAKGNGHQEFCELGDGYPNGTCTCVLSVCGARITSSPPPLETCGHDDSSWCDESCDAINAPAAAGQFASPPSHEGGGPATAGAPIAKQQADVLASRILLGLTPAHPELWRSHIVSVLTAGAPLNTFGISPEKVQPVDPAEVERYKQAVQKHVVDKYIQRHGRRGTPRKPADDTGESR